MKFSIQDWLKPQIDKDKEDRVERNKKKPNILLRIVKSLGPSRKRQKVSTNSKRKPSKLTNKLLTQYKQKRRVKNRIARRSRQRNR